ncbi:hypothetical protein JCM13664_03620 [Methylothermus subterraneus]
MRRLACLLAVVLLSWSLDGLGYGGSKGGGQSCPQPKFAHFNPLEMAKESAGGEVFFLTWSVLPETIEVTVKGQKVALEIASSGPNYVVSATLPQDLTGPARTPLMKPAQRLKCSPK